jgi:spermidine synthase
MINRNRAWFWPGFFLLSFSALFLEVLFTRIFSYIIWHNIAYMVISLAILGIGAGGVWDSIRPKKRNPLNHGWLALLAALAVFLELKLIDHMKFDWGPAGYLYFVNSSLLVFVPFFFLGLVMVRVFSERAQEIGKAYAVNLVASGAGAVAALFILEPLGMPGALFVACALLGLAGLMFAMSSGKALKLAAVCWVLFSLSGLSWADRWFTFKMTPAKPLGRLEKIWPDYKIEFSRWDPIGKIDVISSSQSLLKFDDETFNYRVITNDAAAETPLLDLESRFQDTRFFRGVTYGQVFQYYGKPPENVMVIATGGGSDVLTALYFQARHVSSVEVNGTTFNVLKKYKPWLFKDPRVRLYKGDGRNFVERSREKYDIVTVTGVDTQSALEWGAYIQAENYIHTVEAYQQYLRHLSPGGVVSIILVELYPPRHMLRACAMMVEVMRREGISHPERNIILVQQAQVVVMLAQKDPVDPARLQEYMRQMEASNFKGPVLFEMIAVSNKMAPLSIRYAPGMGDEKDQMVKYFAALAGGTDRAYMKKYPFDISPVTDDRPFFYYVFWLRLSKSLDKIAGNLVFFQLLEALFFSGLFILLPMYALRRREIKGLKGKVWFFLLIGLGYMLIEIPFIQKFVLYLGHPVYSLVLVLVVLLAGSGLGAWLFHAFLREKKWAIWAAVITIIIWSMLGLKLMPWILAKALPAGLPATISLAALFTFILGVAMGVPFPAGINALGKDSGSLVPWAWAINTSASVVSSILAVILAMSLGFTMVALAASAVYLLAGISFHLLKSD